MDIVDSLIRRGDMAQAHARLTELWVAEPGNPNIRRLLGRLDLHLGHAEAARTHFLALYDENPLAPDIAYGVGVASLAVGLLSDAIRFFQQELLRAPMHQGALFNLAWGLRRAGRHAEAVTILRRLAQITPQDADLWFNMGNALTEIDRFADAKESYRKGAALAPERTDILLNLARVCREQGPRHEARQIYESILVQNPGLALAVSGLGTTLVEMGAAEQAEGLLRDGLNKADDSEIAVSLAYALRALQRYGEARDLLVRVLERQPDNAWGWQVLGQVEMALGDYLRADAAFDRGRKWNPKTSIGNAPLSPVDLWHLHPQGAVLRACGGDRIAPPRLVGMALTNKCNLRCDICGSQGTLDATGTLRSHMPIEMFRAMAEILFPTAVIVELNSRGDPLLYPQIDEVLETIARHRCILKLQTNGTLFDDPIIDRLLSMHAEISISVDALGPVFDQVRTNGKWALAEPKIRLLAQRADPKKQRLQLYPTVTARTVPGMLDLVRWADDCGISRVEFHPYDENGGAKIDTHADKDDIAKQLAAIVQWAAAGNSAVTVTYEGEIQHAGRPSIVCGPSVIKEALIPMVLDRPMEGFITGSDPKQLCRAPLDDIDIGIGGEITTCCRASQHLLGVAASPEEFAAVWFGENYRKIRQSLERGATGPLPLPACDPCLRHYAPQASAGRQAVTYSGQGDAAADALVCLFDEIPFGTIQRRKKDGLVFLARAPLGLVTQDYRLYEDETPLFQGGCLIKEVTALGAGRWTEHDGSICFTSSDGSDPQRNGRRYCLRRNAPAR